MSDDMTMDMAEECDCAGCAAHAEGEEKGECTCTNANCKCADCGKAPVEAAEEMAA